MDLIYFIDRFGEGGTSALGGLIIGLLYGASAQRSRFCLRASTVEFARGQIGARTAIWLLCFATAIFWVQGGLLTGAVDLTEARWLATPGSISGALVGGLMFGAGMVLARGCPSRLLVLAASGNLRSLLSGLVFAVSAQMTLHGLFAPIRDSIATAWITKGPNPAVTDMLGVGATGGLVLALMATIVALYFTWRNKLGWLELLAACGVGFSVVLGWWFTYNLAAVSFEGGAIKSLTFSGPSADALMFVLEPYTGGWEFDIGLVPGALLGAAIAALVFGEWKWQGFEGAANMRRYLIGAMLMGVGAMLAGGCAIGAGVSGSSTFALTAWIALTAFWVGAGVTDRLVDYPAEQGALPPRSIAAKM
ncbi:MAG: YeeE/YedE family protein [Neomegalonema sp.]|nr:YeeE/YedE family protein [Neomegalonema sp.]